MLMGVPADHLVSVQGRVVMFGFISSRVAGAAAGRRASILTLRGDTAGGRENARMIALGTTIATFALSLVAWGRFDTANPGNSSLWRRPLAVRDDPLQTRRRRHFHAVRAADHLPDALLHPRLLGIVEHRIKEYLVAFLVLETLMIGVFVALDLVLFYIFFEAGLIPMFLIIGIWGGKRRIYASSSSSSTRCLARC
jgi:NADH-quinone oxidoreductase subunit M